MVVVLDESIKQTTLRNKITKNYQFIKNDAIFH